MIRAVALDLMDTVVTDPFREALRAAVDVELEELHARRSPELYPALERGEIDEADYWSHHASIGIGVDPARFHAVRRAGTRWLPGMRQLLDDLDGAVLRVGASNYPRWIDELAEQLLVGRFERVLASCDLGCRKPDVAFYERLLDELGLEAGEVAFVDDRPANVEAAASLGMAARRFRGSGDLRRWLRGLGVDVGVGRDP